MSLYSSLVAYWKMDEASGSRADSVGSSTLTDNNTVTSNTGLVYATAAEFVIANSEYLSAADSAALSMGDINWWAAAWVQFPTKPGNMTILSKYDTVTNKREYLAQATTTQFSMSVSGDGSSGATTTLGATTAGVPGNSVWHLVVVYHDSANNLLGISVDGGPFDTTAHSSGTFDSTSEFRIGAAVSNGGAANYFGGRIGPVMIGKSYIPTAADVTYLYDSGTGITLAELAADTGHQVINFHNVGDSLAPDLNNSTDANSFATTAWTPSSALQILFVYNREPAGANTITSVVGNGITWTQIATFAFGSSNLHRISLYAADGTGATNGVTTFTFGATPLQQGITALFCEVTGADISGGVAAAFSQVVNNTGGTTAALLGTVTLAAASNAANRPIVCFFHAATELTTPNPDGLWTEVDDISGSGPVRGTETQWRSDAFATNARADWVTSAVWGGLAAEIKALLSRKAPPLMLRPLRVWKKWR